MPVDDNQFKHALSHFASGVTIVTTEHEGTDYGLTVASFASLSLNPPLVLVCINKSSSSHDPIAKSQKFGVSILGSDQEAISGRFAARGGDKFAGLDVRRGSTGVPLVGNALATLECRVHEQIIGGDHSIFIGEVVDTKTREGAPLLYFRAAYREMRL
ncbi:MAG TPA: flavin reductase family protein [Thermoanaerobaculia bacterium]|nr:flavin reductase family protein [Thermoanaerobaculia bacterium]